MAQPPANPAQTPPDPPPIYDFDVAVVGAGPAGSVTAAYAAMGGARVVLLERRARVGEPLQCGELMPDNGELARLCPGVEDIDELFQTPAAAISFEFDTMRFIAPRGAAFAFDFSGYSMVRPRHDQALARRAVKAGAELRTSTQVTKVEGHTLILAPAAGGKGETEAGVAETLTAKVIVGADGPHSLVRRAANLPSPELSPVMLALMTGDFPDSVDLFFGQVAPGGYAWTIPKAGGANIGVGVQARYNRTPQNLRQIMANFEARFEGEVTYRGGGVVPVSGPLTRTHADPYLLVGDAAGHVMPSNGGGICTAMMCGRIAGQVAAAHTTEETAASPDPSRATPLAAYDHRWRAQLGATFKYSVRAKRLADRLFSADWRLNLGMRTWTTGFMARAITCRPMFWIF